MIRTDIFLELRTYLSILRRRWALVAIPTFIVLVLGIVTFQIPDPTYKVQMQYIVSQPPSVSAEIDEEARQFTWVTSQYVVNAVNDWSDGTDFAGRIARQLNAQGIEIDALGVAGSIEVDTFRSILELAFVHPDKETVEAMANAATAVLQTDNADAVPHLGETKATIIPIDEVIVQTLGPGITAYLDIPLRVFVAIAAGVGLAFLENSFGPNAAPQRRLHAAAARRVLAALLPDSGAEIKGSMQSIEPL